MRHTSYFVIVILLVSIVTACNSAKLYRDTDKNRFITGQLEPVTYTSLRNILARYAGGVLKDTIIIKYEFNNEHCWDALDEATDIRIWNVINARKKWIDSFMMQHPNASFLHIREPGDRINKLVKWDKAIVIDSNKQIMRSLFSKKAACGSSAIVVPNGKYLIRQTDAHLEIVNMPANRTDLF